MTLQHINLTDLKPAKVNVRKKGGKSCADLVPSIRSLGLLQPLLLLVFELAVIHQPANRRFGIGYQFDQVDTGLGSPLLGLFQRHNAQLLSVICNQAHFGRGDVIVQTGLFVVCDWGFSRISRTALTRKN